MATKTASYEQATRQVSNLLSALGMNNNAYEDEQDLGALGTFEEAKASMEINSQIYEVTPRTSVKKKSSTPQKDHQGQVAYGLSQEDIDRFTKEDIDTLEEDNPDILSLDITPPPLDSEKYEFKGIVETCGNLKDVWNAFIVAYRRGDMKGTTVANQPLKISKNKDNALEMVYTAADIRYVQGNPPNPLLESLLSKEDLFIWVYSIQEPKELGYIFNGYVYLRKE